MKSQAETEAEQVEQAEHAERMRLLNAAIVRLHGFDVAQLRDANVLLASVALRRRGEGESGGAAA